jgi:hypothetical protein
MLFIHQALILTYLCALIIKSCNMSGSEHCHLYGLGSSAKGVLVRLAYCFTVLRQRTPTARVDWLYEMARVRMLRAFLPFAAGVFLFFVFYALAMLLVLILIYAMRLYYAGYVRLPFDLTASALPLVCKGHVLIICSQVPKIFLVASAHSLPASRIVKNVLARRQSALAVCAFPDEWQSM